MLVCKLLHSLLPEAVQGSHGFHVHAVSDALVPGVCVTAADMLAVFVGGSFMLVCDCSVLLAASSGLLLLAPCTNLQPDPTQVRCSVLPRTYPLLPNNCEWL